MSTGRLFTISLICFATRVAANQYFNNFAKHEILKKLFGISRNFRKIPDKFREIFAKIMKLFLNFEKILHLREKEQFLLKMSYIAVIEK